jgi:16S rRNA pseudouridine516 synthase
MPAIRADQLLSRFGFCSRREAPSWIRAGRVVCSGNPVLRAEDRIDPAATSVDGQPIEFPGGLLVAFHKPVGYACSHNPAEAPLLYDLLPPSWLQRQPPPETVGRLDRETSGLIILSDDFPEDLAAIFASGTLVLRGETKPCRPATLTITSPRTATLLITEGRYHQVRRMFAAHGCPVTTLHRPAIGSLQLGSLAPGSWRPISPADIDPPREDAGKI